MVKKKKIEKFNKKLKIVAKFLLIFNLLAVPLYAAIYTGFFFYPLQVSTAFFGHSFLSAFGYQTVLDGNKIIVTGENLRQEFDISWDSTGWKSMYALVALAIASPVKGKKLKFLAVSLPAIFAINILRVATTIALSVNYGWEYFEIVHTVLWREGMIAAVVAIWALWFVKQKYNIG